MLESGGMDGVLVAAHELKAPLGILRQLALSLDLTEGEEWKRVQNQMVTVSERAMKQVNDLTKVARLDERLFELEPVAVRGVCEQVSGELSSLFSFNHRRLEVKYQNRTRLVVANAELLYSVVYNFCLNALHYADRETLAEMRIRDRGERVRIDVRDYGPALPMEIWRMMKQGWIKQPTKAAMRPGSSGLGLFIASKFSEYMHARMGAVRHRDGTSFFVELLKSRQLRMF